MLAQQRGHFQYAGCGVLFTHAPGVFGQHRHAAPPYLLNECTAVPRLPPGAKAGLWIWSPHPSFPTHRTRPVPFHDWSQTCSAWLCAPPLRFAPHRFAPLLPAFLAPTSKHVRPPVSAPTPPLCSLTPTFACNPPVIARPTRAFARPSPLGPSPLALKLPPSSSNVPPLGPLPPRHRREGARDDAARRRQGPPRTLCWQ